LLAIAALKVARTALTQVVVASPVIEAGSTVPALMVGKGLETSLRRSALGGYSVVGRGNGGVIVADGLVF